MNAKSPTLVLTLIFVITTVLFSGCASNRVNTVKNGTLQVERTAPNGVYFSKGYIYEEDGRLVISGTVKSRNLNKIRGGHVDIAIVSPKGDIIQQSSTVVKTGRLKKLRQQGARFKLTLSTIPPSGSTIRVVYHKEVKIQQHNNLL